MVDGGARHGILEMIGVYAEYKYEANSEVL